MNNLGSFFSAFGQQIVRAVAQQQQAHSGGKRASGSECTPCAAEAYVNALRDKPKKKARSK